MFSVREKPVKPASIMLLSQIEGRRYNPEPPSWAVARLEPLGYDESEPDKRVVKTTDTEKVLRNENGDKIYDNQILKDYFVVTPKNSRWSTLRKCMTWDLGHFWDEPLKERPKYPIHGTQPEVNEEIWMIKDPNHPIYTQFQAVFPQSRAEYQFKPCSFGDIRTTQPLSNHTQQGLAQVTKKRYSRKHYDLVYTNKNPVPEKQPEKYEPPKRIHSFKPRDDAMTQECLKADALDVIHKDVQGIWPAYPCSLMHKVSSKQRKLVDQGFQYEDQDYIRQKVPYDYRHTFFADHPKAEKQGIHLKKEVEKELKVAYAMVAQKHAKHNYDDPPREVGETELMRRTRNVWKPEKKYKEATAHIGADKFDRTHLQRFEPTFVRRDPVKLRGEQYGGVGWTAPEPPYTPTPDIKDYFYRPPVRKGSARERELVRRKSLETDPADGIHLKKIYQNAQKIHPEYESDVTFPDRIRVVAKTEKEKESNKQKTRTQRREEYQNERADRPYRDFRGVDMPI